MNADHCAKCGKPDRPPAIVPYYTDKGYVWMHPQCAPIPERDHVGWDGNGSPAR